MNILNAEQTKALLPYSALAAELASVLRDKRAGTAHAPDRLSLPLQDGSVLLLMPAADEHLAITKLVTVHPANAKHGIPVVQAEVVVMEADTGRRLFMLDGAVVTARRTAALSLLAARLLAYDRKGPLLIVGSGVQAQAHLEAFTEDLGVREVYIMSRTKAHAERLAEYARQLGITARTVTNPKTAMSKATLIVTATTSHEPVISDYVQDHAFIAAVGAFTPEMAELPPELVRRAKLYVDTMEGAKGGAGDLIRAGVDWSQVAPLEDAVILGPPNFEGTPVIFKSVGHALWDLAAARLAHKQLSNLRTFEPSNS